MQSTFPLVKLDDVLKLSLDPVPVEGTCIYEMAGVYSFGRGLFVREPLAGTNTTYKVMHRLHEGDFVLSTAPRIRGEELKIGVAFG